MLRAVQAVAFLIRQFEDGHVKSGCALEISKAHARRHAIDFVDADPVRFFDPPATLQAVAAGPNPVTCKPRWQRPILACKAASTPRVVIGMRRFGTCGFGPER
jgi:hypothetical protein